MDPGVFVSAALSPSDTPSKLVAHWKRGTFDLLVSRSLLGELETVLMRSKFRRYLSEDEASKYIERFRKRATMLPDPDSIPRATPDPKNDYLVALALSVDADFLVSGDPHLTKLEDAPVRVLSPRGFLDLIAG
ncbi:MAG: putative toxin-antitoxin system toxin component, PIN family [Actinomycetota bacterium]|nr:putative toxin-antitoxin system toxin component, PIN family [Actinomycetota bacterium]